MLGVVAQVSNPSYSGGKDQEDQGTRPAWAKKVSKTPSHATSQALWYGSVILEMYYM
jgi:hypothetical protein